MKIVRFFSIIFLIAISGSLFGQVAIGTGTPTPDAKAMLDIQSSTLGLLIPRMSTLPSTPPDGLMVYYTTTHVPYFYSTGTNSWRKLNGQWTTSGSNISYNTTGGKVGIGTASPARLFHLNGTSTITDFHLTNTTTGTLSTDGGTITMSGLHMLINNREAGPLRFQTSGTERMRIDENGNIGIGNTNPLAKLYIQEETLNDPSLFIGRYNNESYAIFEVGEHDIIGSVSSYGGALLHSRNRSIGFSTENSSFDGITETPKMVILTTGEVGVGIIEPTSTLHLEGSFATAITVISTTSPTLGPTNQIVLCDNSTANFQLSLPAASSSNIGRQYTIKNINDTYSVTFSQDIDTDSNVSLSPMSSITIVSDGTDWWKIGN